MIELPVKVIRVLWPAATSDGDWFILLTSQGKAKGKMLYRPNEHDELILTGEWGVYRGEREFAFAEARISVPVHPRDMLHYCATRTNGMGPAMESLLWDRLGADWQSAQENAVPRLKGKLFAEFQLQIEGLKGKSEEARVVATLIGKGATSNMASKAWLQWGQQTLGVVNADCFRLAELEGYSFKDCDGKVRQSYGIADDDKRRIRAAVLYSLRRLTDGGDTIVQWTDLYTQATGMLGGYADLVSDVTSELFEDNTIKAFPDSEGVALKQDWDAESAIWAWVEEVTKKEGVKP